mgnify:CR=1 FL=1
MGETWRTLVLTTGEADQDIGVFESESAQPVSFKVDWLEMARIELEKKDKEIYKGLSDTDALTGLFNRRAFQAAVDETLLKRIAGVFIFIDVDNFKDYNDKYGHANGDLCLKHFAAAMKKCFPKDSILGRYGGDEFVVYIKNAASDDAHRYLSLIHI